jgi:hypothetical protein
MTRVLLYLCGVLFIANVAVALWPDSNRKAQNVYSQKKDLNPHFVRLNKEIDKDVGSTIGSASESEEYANQSALSAMPECYRIGPFVDQENFDLAQAVLLNASIVFQSSTRVLQESHVYRVYLGPFVTQAEAIEVSNELNANNITDHFIRQETESQFIVSLGIFTTEASATSAVQFFDGQLNSVQLKQELVVLPESYWLHFVMDSQSKTKEQLASIDWGEQSAKLGAHECPNAGT